MSFAAVVMFSFPPVVLALFTALPARRAVILTYIACWLFLPSVSFPLPGLPDYSKFSAPPTVILLGVAINDPTRLFSLRPRWFDVPIVVWCVCPFASSVTNGLGYYDGLSGALTTTLSWGFPYLIGRCYFDTLDGLRDLAVGVVTGGLVYVPFCLWEVKMAPNLNRYVYGLTDWEPMRFGGFRPRVFMSTGLEVGMWMTACTLIAYGLWSGGVLKRFRGFPMAPLLALMLVTTVLCKATGAVFLLAAGVVILLSVRVTRSPIPLLLLVIVPLAYQASRSTGLWSGREAVTFAEHYISPDRAQSLEFRLDNENILIDKALQQPVFGWGGWNRARVFVNGVDISVTDGYWIIALGNHGLVGLFSLTAVLLLPAALLVRRYPASTWHQPGVRPAAVLAVLLVLWMIDNLSNAMFNPIYVVMAGGLMALKTPTDGSKAVPGRSAKAAPGENPRSHEDQPLWSVDRQRERAAQLAAAGRHDWADDLYRQTLRDLEALADARPEDASVRRRLAETCTEFGRSLIDRGQTRHALSIWRRAAHEFDGLPDVRREPGATCRRLAHFNDLAWLLATDGDPAVRDPARAVVWAEAAAGGDPENPTYRNTLGVAYLAAGRPADAINALEASVRLGGGGTSFDFFYLALAHARSNDPRAARPWLERALAWMDAHDPKHPHLLRLRREAFGMFNLPAVWREVNEVPRTT